MALVYQPPVSAGLTVAPHQVLLGPAGSYLFTATTADGSPDPNAVWSIAPAGLGRLTPGASPGTITYTAPQTVTASAQVTLTAVSGKGRGSATVTLAVPAKVQISPAAVSLKPGESAKFTASVNTISNTISWYAAPDCGTLTATGAQATYTAPQTASGPVTIIALVTGPPAQPRAAAGAAIATVQIG